MKWVTRERPKIDRIACPWLVARFIDKEPEFLYVPPSEVLSTAKKTGAIPYDVPGVELGHVGQLCSFDAFHRKHGLDVSSATMRGHRGKNTFTRWLMGSVSHRVISYATSLVTVVR